MNDNRLNRVREMYEAFASGDRVVVEAIVTYEMTARDGTRGRNTEVLTFAGDRIRRAEVYFGWDLTSET
jgi:hypothetical protein